MHNNSSFSVTTPTDREILITRVFNAPRDDVFAAMTKPELLKRWLLGPPGWAMTVCENDLCVGGQFRHAWNGPEGAQMAMHGVYREVTPPERIIRSEIFDSGCDAQGGEQIGTLVLIEQGNKTMLKLTVQFQSKEARDAAIASGMERGVAAGYDRLDEILASAK